MADLSNQDPANQSPEGMECREYLISGIKVTVIFPNGHRDTEASMTTVKNILIYAYINNNKKRGDTQGT